MEKNFLAEFLALPTSKTQPSPPSTEEDGDTADTQNFLRKILALPSVTLTTSGMSLASLDRMLCFSVYITLLSLENGLFEFSDTFL